MALSIKAIPPRWPHDIETPIQIADPLGEEAKFATVSRVRSRQNGLHFVQIFQLISLNENVAILITTSLKFGPNGMTTHVPALIQFMAGAKPIKMTSQWARWRLKSPASRLFTQPFIQTQIKENIKAPRHWPLCGEFTGHRGIPRIKDQ